MNASSLTNLFGDLRGLQMVLVRELGALDEAKVKAAAEVRGGGGGADVKHR